MPRKLQVAQDGRGAFTTIRDALEAAGREAVISIAPGDYQESITIRRRHVTLAALEPGTVTIADPQRKDAGISAEDSTVRLEGLVVRSAGKPAIEFSGGEAQIIDCAASAETGTGVVVRNSAEATIRGTAISDSRNGLLITGDEHSRERPSVEVENCSIRNIAEDAITVRKGAVAQVRLCTVTHAGGRGIHLDSANSVSIEQCEIAHGAGTGIEVRSYQVTIFECWVHDLDGIGIVWGERAGGVLHSHLVENTAAPGILREYLWQGQIRVPARHFRS
ncbi:right-handed parallel beta-helix repeat-containing protein [Saccharopolyspora shandongensis]|uniref:right-handed parallel beta-helix repeat-containing protein n=1 Tax=Saccharopolyspora shandongensis TaxID=418495 RepID=UPI0033CA2C36